MPHRTARCPLIRPAAGTAVDFRSPPPPPPPLPHPRPHSFPPFIFPSSLSQHSFHLPHHFVWTPQLLRKQRTAAAPIVVSEVNVSQCVCVTQHMPTHWASAHCLDRLSLPKCKRKTNMFFTYLLWCLAVQIVYSCAYIFSVIFQICSQNLVFEVQILPHIEFFCFYLLSWLQFHWYIADNMNFPIAVFLNLFFIHHTR